MQNVAAHIHVRVKISSSLFYYKCRINSGKEDLHLLITNKNLSSHLLNFPPHFSGFSNLFHREVRGAVDDPRRRQPNKATGPLNSIADASENRRNVAGH